MSRVSNNPVVVPKGVEVTLNGQEIAVKGSNGSLSFTIPALVEVLQEEDDANKVLKFTMRSNDIEAKSLAGTSRSLINNMVTGVSDGFTKKLELQGVGYRAQAKGKVLNLVLGFSHPVNYQLPEGIDIETPSQTEVVIKGIDKQLVGQVAAEIRSLRPPEVYKGKGVRYSGEQVRRKEAKKK